MADRFAENGAIQYALANPEAGSKRAGLAGYIMGALEDWLKNPVPPLSRLSAPGRLRGKFFDSGIAPLAMDFANQQFYSNQNGVMEAKSFSDIVTFSRTSNATVTRADGTIGYAPHNLLTFSEQFDNAIWNKDTSGGTLPVVTANQALAPNGYQTADRIVFNKTGGVFSRIQQQPAATSGVTYTFSVWLKSATGSNVNLGIRLDATGSNCLVTNEWQRFTVSASATTGIIATQLLLFDSIIGNDETADVYVWGAQLEIGSTATTYNSTTVKNLLGFSESFDNAAWTKSNSFVQTNLLTYSEAFDNAIWSKSESSIAGNSIIAPNGTLTADKFIESSASAIHQITRAVSTTSGVSYTYSIYAKAGERNWIVVQIAAGIFAYVNLSNGTVGNTSGSPTVSVTLDNNGFYRISLTANIGATTANTALYIASANGTINYLGDGTSGIYIWGAQFVQGSVAGDYRRTDAAALLIFYPNHNGVVCAQQIQSTAGNGTVLESYTASGVSMTFSIWMRRVSGTGNVDITMDTGTTWTTQAITSSWARYSITSTPASGARTAGVRLVTSGDVIQVFGAQVSPSASLDPYVLNAGAAPSAAAFYGARFDYDPVTKEPKGLLIEEQRTNLLLNSTLPATNLATQNVTVTNVAHTLSFYGTGSITLSGTATATLNGAGAYPSRATLTFTPTAGTLTVTVSGTVQFAQLEIGAFATSFIPTAASQVTRTADVATIQGSNFYSWYNQNEGSLFASSIPYAQTSTTLQTVVSVSDDLTTETNLMAIGYKGTTVQYRNAVLVGGSLTADIIGGTATYNTNHKQVSAYKINDFSFAVDSSLIGTDSSGATPLVTRLNLGRSSAGNTSSYSGWVKQITYYPTRLSNDVLRGLTA